MSLCTYIRVVSCKLLRVEEKSPCDYQFWPWKNQNFVSSRSHFFQNCYLYSFANIAPRFNLASKKIKRIYWSRKIISFVRGPCWQDCFLPRLKTIGEGPKRLVLKPSLIIIQKAFWAILSRHKETSSQKPGNKFNFMAPFFIKQHCSFHTITIKCCTLLVY